MKNLLLKMLFSIVSFIGTFGYNLSTSVMNYEELPTRNGVNNLLGVDDDVDVDENGELYDEDVELEGIGRLIRGKRFDLKDLNRRIRRAQVMARRRRFYRNRRSIVTPNQRYIYGMKTRLNSTTQKQLANKELEYSDGHIYYTKEYQNIAGNKDVIHSNDKIGVGYSNLLDGGKVPAGLIVAVSYISFSTVNFNGASQNLFSKIYEAASKRAEFACSELELIVNGKVMISIPVFMMNEARAIKDVVPNGFEAGINLEKPILIKPDDRVNFNIRMPEGVSITNSAQNKTAVRFNLFGSGTKIK